MGVSEGLFKSKTPLLGKKGEFLPGGWVEMKQRRQDQYLPYDNELQVCADFLKSKLLTEVLSIGFPEQETQEKVSSNGPTYFENSGYKFLNYLFFWDGHL